MMCRGFCKNVSCKLYFAGVLFLLCTLGNLHWSTLLVHHRLSRGTQIYMGFQTIFLMPCLPYFVGIYYAMKELLIPLLITVSYCIFTMLTWIGLISFIHTYKPKNIKDIFDLDGYEKNIVLAFWTASLFVYILVFIIIWNSLEEFDKLPKREELKDQTSKKYAYRRYGIFLVY